MNREEAHALLSEAQAGCNVSERQILAALRVTGDLSGVGAWRAMQEDDPLSPSAEKLHRHLITTARQSLLQAGMGHVTDEFAIQWAEQLLRQNAVRAASFDAREPA